VKTDEITEARFYRTELRQVQAVGRPYRYLEGRAVPYNTWQDVGPFMEMHAEGSFARSTRGGSGKGLPLLVGHRHDDLDNLIGHAESWKQDRTGLYGVWRLNESPKAQQAARLADAGDLRGLSVGFQPVSEPEYAAAGDRGDKAWVIWNESRLLEVSVTPVPAFPDAEVTLVRTLVDPKQPPRPTPDLDHWRQVAAGLHSR
jgi:HK97 family phage prohead protease